MLTDKEIHIILDKDCKTVDFRNEIISTQHSDPLADALSNISPKEKLQKKIYRKMTSEDIDKLEIEIYSNINEKQSYLENKGELESAPDKNKSNDKNPASNPKQTEIAKLKTRVRLLTALGFSKFLPL